MQRHIVPGRVHITPPGAIRMDDEELRERIELRLASTFAMTPTTRGESSSHSSHRTAFHSPAPSADENPFDHALAGLGRFGGIRTIDSIG